ncbi:MAG: pyrroloquinoline quinone biosynthesis peptide chaperone PqqD [Candidatus Binataceae bacterium]|nr:pyrroloquinoline quinone biosynthesis peptide chaperone PqqD [Candidatus Binataceae bacterium]
MTPADPRRDAEWQPRLAARARIQYDAIACQDLLLFPEAALVLNATAAAIVRLCDGERSVSAIADAVAEQFSARDPAAIAADVDEFIRQLGARGLLE